LQVTRVTERQTEANITETILQLFARTLETGISIELFAHSFTDIYVLLTKQEI